MTFLLKFGIQTQVHYIPLYKHPFYKSLSKNILLKEQRNIINQHYHYLCMRH